MMFKANSLDILSITLGGLALIQLALMHNVMSVYCIDACALPLTYCPLPILEAPVLVQLKMMLLQFLCLEAECVALYALM
jgi:hypothetical protein